MIVGFIGLGNLGEKLAATLLRNNINLIVHDKLKKNAVQLIEKGANWEDTTIELAKKSDFIITCLPSPSISATVMETRYGVIEGISKGKIWIEMSTPANRRYQDYQNLFKIREDFQPTALFLVVVIGLQQVIFLFFLVVKEKYLKK